jgi:hypothetical protein
MEQMVFCGLMVFILRYRSLRSFIYENRDNDFALKNFQRWLSFKGLPSDDELRYSLQTVPTRSLNKLLQQLHSDLDRKKILKNQSFLGHHQLVSLDGTGQISSEKIHCERCLTRIASDGTVLYYHGQLLASLTNQKAEYALPLQFESIERDDVDTKYSKNDCEINAAKRLIPKMKTQFPKRNFCFLGDNLFAAESMTELILENSWHFIFTAKPEKNRELFLMYAYVHERQQSYKYTDRVGRVHHYRWSNQLPIKQARYKEDVRLVNLLEYQEIDATGKLLFKSAWMTDFVLSQDNVCAIAEAGRARFVIENRNFNEQKNLGFHTEHNFGHFGNLPNVFFGLAQIAQLVTELFRLWRPAKAWIAAVGSKRRYFERLAVIISTQVLVDDGLPIIYLKFELNSS